MTAGGATFCSNKRREGDFESCRLNPNTPVSDGRERRFSPSPLLSASASSSLLPAVVSLSPLWLCPRFHRQRSNVPPRLESHLGKSAVAARELGLRLIYLFMQIRNASKVFFPSLHPLSRPADCCLPRARRGGSLADAPNGEPAQRRLSGESWTGGMGWRRVWRTNVKMKGLHCPRLAGNSGRGHWLGTSAENALRFFLFLFFACEPEISGLEKTKKWSG